MKGMFAVVASVALTALCWGVYGPVLHVGQHDLHSRLLPFICVGLAYFVIAVLVPGAMLAKGETGHWSKGGTLWSLAAGAAGAIGALGIIMALSYGGSPIYVMPLVFGGAPVVNTFLTMFMARTYKEVGLVFLFGLLMVATGAVLVMVYKPSAGGSGAPKVDLNLPMVIFNIAATALAWGVYGPVLHKGQAAMGGSKLRPLICVGVAYFIIAVMIPTLKVMTFPEGVWTMRGAAWSLGAGAAGAIGALGIIMAFNYGGKPIYVMPLVFGGAPVVNAMAEIVSRQLYKQEIHPLFFASMALVAIGAVTALVSSPKPAKKPVAAPHAPPAKPVPA